ncbi:hypothetical protein CQA53_02015 [Helicobacter didelphidarum]|uniref:Uncharacterized protein n=1 Tax=Helicobacter didelphidarum TaxID=2040648 RepID=A0A3D8IP69_9HELI|nr:hypothetical protein [Helicobacter didelphidarum]RDU67058.1 hypothetical protein CQA53_02015 [Helicobacter didelphidarum]
MKNKKKQNNQQDIEILKDFLELENKELTTKIQTFFHLLYLKSPENFIMTANPITILKKLYEDDKNLNIHEICAILLTCNMQNLETFMKIPSFTKICALFSPNFSQLPSKYHLNYIQCLQASILFYLDSKAIKIILRHIKILRESGIISFHDEKCLEVAMIPDKMTTQTNKKENTKTYSSFLHVDLNKTLFKNQLVSILQAKKILKTTQWAKSLVFLCEEDFTKHICIVGGKKTGKSTFLATLLYDNKKDSQQKIPLEAIAPIEYIYGKDSLHVSYMHFNDLKSLGESPNTEVSTLIERLQQEFHNSLKHGSEKAHHNTFYEDFYSNDKIKLVNHVSISSKNNLFKYVNFINTPSLIPPTFRHLQIYHYILKSNIVFYMTRTDTFLQNSSDINKEAELIVRLLIKENIEFIYVVCTQMDKINLTLKRRQNIYTKLKASIESLLNYPLHEKQRLLKKLVFHCIATNAAYNIRSGKNITSESSFDITSSGILELENELFEHIFQLPLKHYNIEILKNVLSLYKKNYFFSKRSEDTDIKKQISNISESYYMEVTHEINILKQHLQTMLQKLPTQYSSFYSSFTNLRDNLYSQFIQSLNYETKTRANFNIKRLKTSTIESIIVGLQGLSEILQEHFLSLNEFQAILKILNPKDSRSFVKFSYTPEHKNILEILFTHFQKIIHENLFDDSNAIVTEHLSNIFDTILPSSIKKNEIQEDSVVKPIRESFEYYFLLLERNINMLFNKKVQHFSSYIEMVEIILESIFLHYYKDSTMYEVDECKSILKILENRGEA